jgi:hypothetical protein
MNQKDRHSARRLGAFMYGLIRFVQENPALTAAANPPIQFLPQLIPHFRRKGPLQDIRSAVTGAQPFEGKAELLLVEITWDEASRKLTFSAPPQALVAVTPMALDLSDAALDRAEAEGPKIEARAPESGGQSFIFDEEREPAPAA